MKSFMEGIGKFFVIKGFYRNFLTLKGKFHHQSQNYSKIQSMHIKTIRKEDKNKTNFQNPFEGDDNIENNFLKNYFPNITNQYLHHNIL